MKLQYKNEEKYERLLQQESNINLVWELMKHENKNEYDAIIFISICLVKYTQGVNDLTFDIGQTTGINLYIEHHERYKSRRFTLIIPMRDHFYFSMKINAALDLSNRDLIIDKYFDLLRDHYTHQTPINRHYHYEEKTRYRIKSKFHDRINPPVAVLCNNDKNWDRFSQYAVLGENYERITSDYDLRGKYFVNYIDLWDYNWTYGNLNNYSLNNNSVMKHERLLSMINNQIVPKRIVTYHDPSCIQKSNSSSS